MRLSTVLVALVFLCSAGPVLADKRVALVIGNSAYQNTKALPNPKNDATAIGAVLKRLGFQTTTLTDQSKAAMERALMTFGDELEGASVGLFYYAGHGLQVNGQNYLIPVDASLSKERDVSFQAIDVGLVLRQLESGTRTSLVFLDACRDNPLANKLADSLGGKRSLVGRGLARIDATAGILISYATKEGTTADDGSGGNSPYTQALLKHLETPGLEIGMLLRRVRQDVLSATGNQQIPWEYGSLLGEFYLKAPAAAGSPAPPAPAASGSGDAAEFAFWDSVKTSTSPSDYLAYLEAYPAGHFAALARVRSKASAGAQAAAVPAAPASPGAADEASRRQAEALARVRQLPLILVQYALSGLGHFDGAADGNAGPATTRAIKAYQQSLGQAVDGKLTAQQTVSLVQQAASRGQAESLTTLGMMLASGIGVLQDEAAAVEVFRRASNLGNAFGQFNLGVMYRDGRGVAADKSEAARLFRSAKAGGFQKAEAALKEMGR